jgi:hypothetical protein
LAQKKIKMIRRGHYSSNDFQDSTKIKSSEKKILGYLPRVLFFNAFELGTVIREDAHISTGKNLKQERASKSKYETNLNLNHFL